MSDAAIDELGPVDFIVVEFPAGERRFSGEMAAELGRLIDAGVIRLLDLIMLAKSDDGAIEAFEIEDTDMSEIAHLEMELADLLAGEDIVHLAEAMEPGTVAGVLVWENLWAAPFGSAARRAGGQLIASGRIPVQALLAAVEADESPEGD